jgi:hypothetical protein
VDARTGLDNAEKGKFLTLPGLELRSVGRAAVARRYTDCAIPVHTNNVIESLNRLVLLPSISFTILFVPPSDAL